MGRGCGEIVHGAFTVCSHYDDPLQPVTQDETVSVGGTVTLTCRVAASDNSSLQWSNTAQQTLYFGEKRALRDNRIQLHRSTGTELSITIGNVQLSDEGEYTCSIFTMPVRTARATVTVLGVPDKPQISGYEDTVQEGGKVTLTCTSSGSKPPAKLRWYRNQEELTDFMRGEHPPGVGDFMRGEHPPGVGDFMRGEHPPGVGDFMSSTLCDS
ncbi:cell adhesion molecule 3-like [Salvelinus namaycush]|uniref:Cell adhesion molecule 3-like n=1 Tax=Salvelinus namaycush TaxID=8040 RepID=A0A8U0QN61_SALNM|nr:cell adhesion molecule 3-like [Salvelinus namaycush]